MILASAMVFGMLIVPADAEDPIVHNIAASYSDKLTGDQNMVWFLMDFAVYEELYPDSEYVLTAQKKAECYDAVLANAQDDPTAGDLAKDILASSALGYDANDIAAKLTALVDEKSADVTNIYTLSYAIIALQQGADYATADQMRYLVKKALSSRKKWQDTEWGVDAATPMILALAPYYDMDSDVRSVIDESIEIVRSKQDDTGLIDNAASTALAIIAYAALGMDTDELVAGLMTQVNETYDGFEPMKNSFSTEEGWRALLANELAKKGKRMFDFSGYDPTQIQPTEEPTEAPTAAPQQASAGGGGGGGGGESATAKPTATPTEAPTAEPTERPMATPTAKPTAAPVVMPTVKPTPEPVKAMSFSDVKADDWYYDAVSYVYKNDLMQGTDDGFEPGTEMTRAMLVTVLYRMEAPSDVAKQYSFNDVSSDAWYADAVAWASSNGIATGTSDTEFAPDMSVSREQMAAIFYRYAVYKGYDTTSPDTLDGFTDISEINDWATDALKWANAKGIITGVTDTELSPKSTATRAQVATILMRFCEL